MHLSQTAKFEDRPFRFLSVQTEAEMWLLMTFHHAVIRLLVIENTIPNLLTGQEAELV